MTVAGGAAIADDERARAFLESLRAAARAAIEADEGEAAVELLRMVKQRKPAPPAMAPVACLELARHRRRMRGR